MTIQEYLVKLCYFVGIEEQDLQVGVEEIDDRIDVEINLPEEMANQFIGSRGQNLRSLRSVLAATFFEKIEGKRLFVDINGYLREKEQQLVDKALDMAERVLDNGQPQTLYDLNSYERYLIHSTISQEEGFEEIGSYSTSVGSSRYLTICLKEDLPEEGAEEKQN